MSKKMNVTRIEKLAMMYGPSVRFFPEGTEAVDGAIKDAENADLKDNAEFDKVRQQVDMEKANAAKARESAETATTQLGEANSQVETLKAELAVAQANAKASGVVVDLKASDYTDSDVAIVNAVNALKTKLEAKDLQLDALNKKADSYEADQAKTSQKAQQEAQYQELLTEMDLDYGVEHRNAAVTAFEAKHAAGEVTGGPAKATRILEKCYKDAVKAAKAKDAKETKDVTLDSGSGGGISANYSGVELKAGSLDDVTKQAGAVLNKTG